MPENDTVNLIVDSDHLENHVLDTIKSVCHGSQSMFIARKAIKFARRKQAIFQDAPPANLLMVQCMEADLPAPGMM